MTPLAGIDAPPTVSSSSSSIDVVVSTGSDSVLVSSDDPPWSAELDVGDDGKVSVPLPPGAKDGTRITITDSSIPPNSAVVEVVSTS